jgi:hypothetical protein
LDRLDGAADQAARSETYVALAALSGQLHKGIEVAAKMQGTHAHQTEEKPNFSINISVQG